MSQSSDIEFLGYAAEHHGIVQVVCKKCHLSRERKRGLYATRKAADKVGVNVSGN